jgi:hypothetical protein
MRSYPTLPRHALNHDEHRSACVVRECRTVRCSHIPDAYRLIRCDGYPTSSEARAALAGDFWPVQLGHARRIKTLVRGSAGPCKAWTHLHCCCICSNNAADVCPPFAPPVEIALRFPHSHRPGDGLCFHSHNFTFLHVCVYTRTPFAISTSEVTR